MDLPAELQVMPFNLRLMELVGMWGPTSKTYRFYLSYSFGIMMILFPKIFLGMGSDRFDDIAKGLSELLFQTNLYVSVAIFAIKRSAFERMVDILSEIFRKVTGPQHPRECYEMICEQNKKNDKFAKFYALNCCFGPFVYTIPAFTTTYLRYFSASGNYTEEPLRFELPMEQEFYGLQIRTNFVHYHIFLALGQVVYCYCAYISVIKVTSMLILIKYSSLTYRLIAVQIRYLRLQLIMEKKEDYAKMKIEQLVKIVQLHESAFEMTKLVEEIVHIPMAMQFMTCIMVWCLIMLYVSTNITLTLFNLMVPFWLSVIETYGFSYLGTELMQEAAAVGTAIYELPWYEDSVELQRYYRLIIQRTQRTTGVTAAKFFYVGIEKFGSVVNMSYTYYLVLKDALSKNSQ
ncbi:odorant receptor 45b-like [Toxorhynchites rutilus septentrionalis]|uniref:odorant receptor 45b-like n=1 Tax=Toxorhynchites rutilus septentrionalis TaxID=329112 RepID=UPI00247AAB6E|nr:odorant receptor 45b-like [Toxorhynchites rutilus septentrionalis]